MWRFDGLVYVPYGLCGHCGGLHNSTVFVLNELATYEHLILTMASAVVCSQQPLVCFCFRAAGFIPLSLQKLSRPRSSKYVMAFYHSVPWGDRNSLRCRSYEPSDVSTKTVQHDKYIAPCRTLGVHLRTLQLGHIHASPTGASWYCPGSRCSLDRVQVPVICFPAFTRSISPDTCRFVPKYNHMLYVKSVFQTILTFLVVHRWG